MTSPAKYRYPFLLILILISTATFGQHVVVGASLDKNKIVLGEQAHLTLQAEFPSTEPMRFFSIDTIPHFEILIRPRIDTIDKNGSIELKQILTLTSFDSGHWVIPAFELGGGEQLSTDTIPVDVGFSPFDPNQDYHDIKDVIDVEVKKKNEDWYWYAIAGGVLVLAIVIYFITRKKKPVQPKAVVIDPYKEAMNQLEVLKKQDPEPKLFYTKLIDIFRLYVWQQKNISSLQKTTDDLALQLRLLKLGDEPFNKLAQTLRISDFVKFARYQPGPEEKTEAWATIYRSIDLIEKINPPGVSAK